MRSGITPTFRKLLKRLPPDARKDAIKAYRLWKTNPYHPALHFKEIKIDKIRSVWSVRTELNYRALGIKPQADLIMWYWIGPHTEYDLLITSRRAKKAQIP